MTRRVWIAPLLIVVSAVVIVLVSIYSGGSSGPDPAACKAAMQKQFAYGVAHPDGPAGTRPSECKGVSDKDVQRFASEIMNDYMNGSGS